VAQIPQFIYDIRFSHCSQLFHPCCTIIIGGSPGMAPAVAYRPTYSFTIDGADRKVTGVVEFEAAHP
jgi:hypothetical protein